MSVDYKTPEQLYGEAIAREVIGLLAIKHYRLNVNFIELPSGKKMRWNGRPVVEFDDSMLTDAEMRKLYPESIAI